MKPYVKSSKILEELRLLLRERQCRGELILPGIRELAKEFDASCGTIIKSLNQLRDEGLIYQEKKSTRIRPAAGQALRYGFVYTGHRGSGCCWFSAYDRLRFLLERMMNKQHLQLECFLYDPEDPAETPESFAAGLAGVDVLFVSLILDSRVMPLLRQACSRLVILDPYNSEGSRDVVILDLCNSEDCRDASCIQLDNRAVGRIAAELFMQAQCRNILCVIPQAKSTDILFRLRLEGFAELFANEQRRFSVVEHQNADTLKSLQMFRDRINQAVSEGGDGIFCVSDENISEISEELFRSGKVPSEVSIIAFDGTNRAIRHSPPITTISHGDEQIAVELLKLALRLESNPRQFPVITRLIAPQVYPGATVRKVMKERHNAQRIANALQV